MWYCLGAVQGTRGRQPLQAPSNVLGVSAPLQLSWACAYVCAAACLCCCQVKLPHVDWGRVMEADLQHAPSFKLATGYERLQMPGGIQVSKAAAVAAAYCRHRSCACCVVLQSEVSRPLMCAAGLSSGAPAALLRTSPALVSAVCARLSVLLQVLIVEQAAHIPSALSQLRASMQDPVVAIDLEWRPEHGRGFTPVAMVQLSSSK